MKPRITILIPCYNEERIIRDTIESALNQDYQYMKILVIDDCSTDKTADIVGEYIVKLIINEKNLGFTGNFNKLISKCTTEYFVFLCGDDVFTDRRVVSDIVKTFDDHPDIGVIGRYYYQYLDGIKGPVMTIRNEILSFCNPSGIAFRKDAVKDIKIGNTIFTEIPKFVKDVLDSGWKAAFMRYDTIAARLHPGLTGNEACKPSYYLTDPRQSIVKNWTEVIGKPFIYGSLLIQLKNRCPELLKSEIKLSLKLGGWKNIGFLLCVLIALFVPGRILRPLSLFYRNRITRLFVQEIKRHDN